MCVSRAALCAADRCIGVPRVYDSGDLRRVRASRSARLAARSSAQQQVAATAVQAVRAPALWWRENVTALRDQRKVCNGIE